VLGTTDDKAAHLGFNAFVALWRALWAARAYSE